jgi:micrococcal nuclease
LKRRNSAIIAGGAAIVLLVVIWRPFDSGSDVDTTQFSAGGPRGPIEAGFRVNRVVDGDTVEVTRNGVRSKVRLLGIDAPESVKPDSPVECFGPESSDFATTALQGRDVVLEFDRSQSREDQYGRTLAYVWVDGVLFNEQAVALGYSERYRASRGLSWERELQRAERSASADQLGLWGVCR